VAKLPTVESGNDDVDYDTYRIALTPFSQAEDYIFRAHENPRLMTSIIWYQFKSRISDLVVGNCINAEVIDRYSKFISFAVDEFPEGKRVVNLSPYYLAATKQFGFLLDFSFDKSPNVSYGKKIQQLTFSIDKAGKSNANSYLDKMNFLIEFIQKTLSNVCSVMIGDNEYRLATEFTSLNSQELNSRVYLFGNGKENVDKVRGIKSNPYSKPPKDPLFVFVFKDKEKGSGNELYRAMIGKSHPATFAGMKEWFDCEMNIGNVTNITVDFSNDSSVVKTLISRLEAVLSQNQDKQLIGMFVDSYSHGSNRSESYTKAKYAFFKLGIPLQVVRNDRIIASDGLKWAISGIGLQTFAKLGGIPWLVKPSKNTCLIFGVGKAHDIQWQKNGSAVVKKYFAYSVCFDSTGQYRSLGVLCDTDDRATYYKALEINIVSQIKSLISSGHAFTDCVIHTPFRMRDDEVNSIRSGVEQLVKENSGISFAVMRINEKSRFFGFANNNLKVPFESSYIKLSSKEYLVWFDGLRHGKEYINKRVANPTYIEFFRGGNSPEKVIQLLQDAVNLAGASWRGFNTKLEPISIFYPQLIARFIRDFRKIDPEQSVAETLAQFATPWFL